MAIAAENGECRRCRLSRRFSAAWRSAGRLLAGRAGAHALPSCLRARLQLRPERAPCAFAPYPRAATCFPRSPKPSLRWRAAAARKMHALAIVVDELERHPHVILGLELAQIAHVRFGREAGMPVGPHVIEAASQKLEYLVDRAIEKHVVIGHIEMAIIVDPAGLDSHQRRNKRGKEQRFKIAAFEHGATLRPPACGRPSSVVFLRSAHRPALARHRGRAHFEAKYGPLPS